MSILIIIGLAELIERLAYFSASCSKRIKRYAYGMERKKAMQARREKRREFV